MIEHFGEFDFLLVEGLKTLPLPRIAIFRNRLDESYFDCSDAMAIDQTIDPAKENIPTSIDILDLNDPEAVIEWIKQHAKEV
jgi:molybdopterin-guanine dinucleotide biosynthesis protein B